MKHKSLKWSFIALGALFIALESYVYPVLLSKDGMNSPGELKEISDA